MADQAASEIVLNLAPTGMLPMSGTCPGVPLQPADVVRDVVRCAEMGITVVHVHARDELERPTHSKKVYAAIIEGIRQSCPEMVICVSCSGRTVSEIEARSEVLFLPEALRPDMASLTLSSVNFNHQATLNSPDAVSRLASCMLEKGIKPELEIFDLGMANYASYLLKRGLLEPPLYANLFFGNVASAQATLLHMASMTQTLPEGTTWAFAGIGRVQRKVAGIAVAMGAGVRVGLEDNIWADDQRTRTSSNREQVEWVHSLAGLHDLSVMTPATFRKKLGLY